MVVEAVSFFFLESATTEAAAYHQVGGVMCLQGDELFAMDGSGWHSGVGLVAAFACLPVAPPRFAVLQGDQCL